MYMSVLKSAPNAANVTASWHRAGDNQADFPAGIGQVGGQGTLYFALSDARLNEADMLGCEAVDIGDVSGVLRLDEVAFPVGSIAHRHTHTGAGWRHLVSGALRIETDHGAQIMEAGMSWFEPSDSPVRAVALQDSGVTRFVRCMVIPQEFMGRSTFQLCDPKDAELPRLQVTHRHFDHIL